MALKSQLLHRGKTPIQNGKDLFRENSPWQYFDKLKVIPKDTSTWLKDAYGNSPPDFAKFAMDDVAKFLEKYGGKRFGEVYDKYVQYAEDPKLIHEGKIYFEIYSHEMDKNSNEKLPDDFTKWVVKAKYKLLDDGINEEQHYHEIRNAIMAFLKANEHKTYNDIFGNDNSESQNDLIFEGRTYFEIYTKHLDEKTGILPTDFTKWAKTAKYNLYKKRKQFEGSYEKKKKAIEAFLAANDGKTYEDVFGEKADAAMAVHYGDNDIDEYLYDDNRVQSLWSVDDSDRYIGYVDGGANSVHYHPKHVHGQVQNDLLLGGTLLLIVVLMGCLFCACAFVVTFATGWYVGGQSLGKKTNAYERVVDNDDHLRCD